MTLKDDDIQYILPDYPTPLTEPAQVQPLTLAMDETYIEAKPMIIQEVDLTDDALIHRINYCKFTHQDGDFHTLNGAHWTYTAETNEVQMQGFANFAPACKHFSPPRNTIEALGAELSKEYKYDKPYEHQACCQSRQIDSPYCIAGANHTDCVAYQPEDWQTVKFAITEDNRRLEWIKGRLTNGVPYSRVELDNTVLSAAVGDKISELESTWNAKVEETNASEQPQSESGPKNPYLESLLV